MVLRQWSSRGRWATRGSGICKEDASTAPSTSGAVGRSRSAEGRRWLCRAMSRQPAGVGENEEGRIATRKRTVTKGRSVREGHRIRPDEYPCAHRLGARWVRAHAPGHTKALMLVRRKGTESASTPPGVTTSGWRRPSTVSEAGPATIHPVARADHAPHRISASL